MDIVLKTSKLFAYILSFVSLVSCFNHAPQSKVSGDQTVDYNQVVMLTAESWDEDNDIVSQAWTKVLGGNLSIRHISDTRIQFTTPISTKPQTFLFTFDVVDSEGAISKKPVYVHVNPLLPQAPLNDTGVMLCADYASDAVGSMNENNDVDCELEFDTQDGDIVPSPQDGHVGLDVINENQQGFDFTKLDNNGDELLVDATDFNCVKDNVTGLIWESKTYDESEPGLHDKLESYSWYEEDNTINSGDSGDFGPNTCFGYDATDPNTFCNTQAFRYRVNQIELCGLSNWRLPTKQELTSIIDYSRTDASVNLEFFPNTHTHSYWTIHSEARAGREDRVWYVYFNDGSSATTSKDTQNRIRLVHDAVAQ